MLPPPRPADPGTTFAVNSLRRVGYVALLTSLLGTIVLLATAYYLGTTQEQDYVRIFHAKMLTKRQLVPILTMVALFLIAAVALVTWSITLYSTYRVAGPLHRFSQNLERQIADGPLAMEDLHPQELLQEEYRVLQGSTERLQAYYDSMSELVDLATLQLTLPDPNLGGGLAKTLAQLREMSGMILVNDGPDQGEP